MNVNIVKIEQEDKFEPCRISFDIDSLEKLQGLRVVFNCTNIYAVLGFNREEAEEFRESLSHYNQRAYESHDQHMSILKRLYTSLEAIFSY